MTIGTIKDLVDILLALLLGTSIGVATYTFKAMRMMKTDCKERLHKMECRMKRLEETAKILRRHTFGEDTKFYTSTDGINFNEVLPLAEKESKVSKSASGKREKKPDTKKGDADDCNGN